MNIAIIENQDDRFRLLKEATQDPDWKTFFFRNSSEFGLIDLGDYDVILVEKDLPNMDGGDLIKSVANKTHAELFLMSDHPANFDKGDIADDRIKGFIDTSNSTSILDSLRYVDAKIRIKRLMELERSKYDNSPPSNGYDIVEENGVILIDIHENLAAASRNSITDFIKSKQAPRVMITINKNDTVSSPYLGILASIYKAVKNKNGKMAFVDSNENEAITSQIKSCNLDNLFPIFIDRVEAEKFLLT